MSMLIIGGNKMTTKTVSKGLPRVVIPFRAKKKEERPLTLVESIHLVLEVAESARDDAKEDSVLKSERLAVAISYLKNFIGGQ